MKYALYDIRKRMSLLEFDRSCGFISEGQYQREMAILKSREAKEIAKDRRQRKGPREPAPRIWKEYLGCLLPVYLLLSLTPLGKWPDAFASGTLAWGLAMALLIFLTVYLSVIPAFFIACRKRKC
jgi:hypothetical protein